MFAYNLFMFFIVLNCGDYGPVENSDGTTGWPEDLPEESCKTS